MNHLAVTAGNQESAWLIVYMEGQRFAFSIEQVQGVLRHYTATPLPLSPPEFIGTMNLRGRIVSLLDTGLFLGQSPLQENHNSMGVVVEYDGFLYCLLVDEVGQVLNLPDADIDPAPANIAEEMREYITGVCRMADGPLLLIDISRFLGNVTGYDNPKRGGMSA